MGDVGLIEGADVCFGEVYGQRCQRVVELRHFRGADQRGRNAILVEEQDHPVLGKVRLPNLPFRFSDCDTTPRRVAPLLGQHNVEIARELGIAESEIAAMKRENILVNGPAADS